MQWHTQGGSITNNLKVRIDFILPKISAKTIVTWNCHVNESAKVRYDMILGVDILTDLILNIILSDHIIEAENGTFKGSKEPMVDLCVYQFKY